MKKIIISTFVFVFAGVLASCDQNPDSGFAPEALKASAHTSANPEIVFTGKSTSKKGTFETISVMDADGGHETSILTASSTATQYLDPTWSPNNTNVSYSQDNSVRKMDVALTGGVPTASNFTTLYTAPAGTVLTHQGWSPDVGRAEIGFVLQSGGTTSAAANEVRVISSNGGASTLVYSDAGYYCKGMGWNADGSVIYLAEFTVGDGIGNPNTNAGVHGLIKAIDRATGTLLATYLEGTHKYMSNIRPSRSGSNQLIYNALDGTGDNLTTTVVTYDFTSETTRATVTGQSVGWSGTNDKLLYVNSPNINAYTISSGTTTTLTTDGSGYPDWKR
jgi:hypothetical protein